MNMFLPPMPTQNIPVVVQPVEQCCWCWYLLHPGQPYPEKWSSDICPGHISWIEQQVIERRVRLAVKEQVN